MKEARKSGVSLILIGVGIPLILFFFQTSGEFRFLGNVQVFERSLTPAEISSIKQAIEEEKENMGVIQKARLLLAFGLILILLGFGRVIIG